MITYKSTRGSKNYKSAAQAVIQGIAEDKGLYVPESVPALPMPIEDMIGMPYKEVAYHIIKTFFDETHVFCKMHNFLFFSVFFHRESFL